MTRTVPLLFGLLIGVATASADDTRSAVTLRVLSYNIHHGRGVDDKVDLPRIARVIVQVKPDLVALQEVDNKTKRTGGVDQTAELAKLTGLHGQFGKAIPYEGGEYGQAVLSKFPLGEIKVHHLPGMDRESRIAAEVRVKVNGAEIAFVTTHLHHQNEPVRREQAAALNGLFGTVTHPVILAGDFNDLPTSPSVALLTKSWLMATAGPKLYSFGAKNPTKQIDYIFVRPAERFRVVEAKVIDEAMASDHRPILAVVEYRP